MRKLAAEAAGGDYGEMPTEADVIASKYIAEMPPLYTVWPASAEQDEVVEYGPELRVSGRDKLESLKAAAGPAMKKLTSMMRGAIQASRQSLVIGGMEEGDGIDMDALPGIAMGFNDPAIFTSTMRRIDESTYVHIQVDCSGSMGNSKPAMVDGKPTATTKAAYAAITAMALHRALQGCRIPHSVTGYNTKGGSYAPQELRPDGKYQLWSRSRRAMRNHVFVPAPGQHDDGSALPFITGGGCNLDGESLTWAAKYAALHGGNYDRVIMLVIADGLPAGADDGRIEGPYLKQQVEAIARAEIEVYGIGVGIRDWSVFSEYYPDNKGGNGRAPTGAVEIESGKGLTDGVLRQLTALLTRGYGMTRKGASMSVPGEGLSLSEWEDRIQGYSRRVVGRRRLGMELDDVAQDLRMTFINAVRKYAATHGGEIPPGQLMTTVLQRRVGKLNRGSRVWFRMLDDSVRRQHDDDSPFDTVPDEHVEQADQEMARAETEAACEALVYALRANVTPMTFAILHLRLIEELTPSEIAEVIDGTTTAGGLSKRIAYAKRIAADFLASRGIHTMEDLE